MIFTSSTPGTEKPWGQTRSGPPLPCRSVCCWPRAGPRWTRLDPAHPLPHPEPCPQQCPGGCRDGSWLQRGCRAVPHHSEPAQRSDATQLAASGEHEGFGEAPPVRFAVRSPKRDNVTPRRDEKEPPGATGTGLGAPGAGGEAVLGAARQDGGHCSGAVAPRWHHGTTPSAPRGTCGPCPLGWSRLRSLALRPGTCQPRKSFISPSPALLLGPLII